jgi:hypothetical protein
MCLTEECELMITGALPFEVSGQNCLFNFEQLAKFEKSVVIS